MKRHFGLVTAAALLVAAPAHASQDQAAFDRAVAAVQARMEPIDAMEDRIPGRVLVFTSTGADPVVDVRGVANVETGQSADADTPFYIASMTKAFVGLMAVRLDMDGTLPLETTLAEIYPGMRVEGVDLSQVTLRDALSHRLGFNSPALSFRTSYTDAVPVGEFAKVVNASQEPTDRAFSYANLGYLLYAGALEKRTGRSWKSWLDQLVLMPLGMHHSSARTSDLPLASHTHELYVSGWRTYPPKTDAIMHAAGGMVVSGGDMARWLSANAGGDSAIAGEVFDAAQTKLAETTREAGPVNCTGYALGWTLCEAGGIRFLEHGGTYTGARSEMIVLPDHGAGFAAIFNSDSMTGGLGQQLVATFVMAYAGQADGLPAPEAFAQRYAERADGYRANRSDTETQLAALDWSADRAQLEAYGGVFVHPALGELDLAVADRTLRATLNGTALVLQGIEDDHYAARISTGSGYDDFRLVRGDDGAVVAVEWDGDVFQRRATP